MRRKAHVHPRLPQRGNTLALLKLPNGGILLNVRGRLRDSRLRSVAEGEEKDEHP